jgi:broad specificity phosphatase PhoE
MRNMSGPMKTVWLLLLVLLLAPAIGSAQALVLIVRHAERADGGSMSTTAETDPHLSAAGEARARRLAEMLGESGIKGIYVTEFKRTQETAKPLADILRLTPVVSASRDAAAIAARLKAEHPRDVVLLVAHSSTLPALVKALGGPVITIPEEQYGDLFVIVPGTGAMTRVKF